MEKSQKTSKTLQLIDERHSVVEPSVSTFPVGFLRQRFSPDTYQVIDWHWHDGTQFCYVTEGAFRFQVVDSTIWLTEGEGIFVNAQQVHTAVSEQAQGEYLCLNLSPYLLGLEGSELYSRFMAPVLFQRPVPYLAFLAGDAGSAQLLAQLRQCALEAAETGGSHELSLLAHMIELWAALWKILPEPGGWVERSKRNDRMQELLSYLRTHYTRKITLQDIADHVHLSRSECARFFRSIAGLTLFQYLTELRVDRSIELLTRSDKSIAEIAYETGFSSQSYFCQRFRAVKGVSPEQFRKDPSAKGR